MKDKKTIKLSLRFENLQTEPTSINENILDVKTSYIFIELSNRMPL